MELRSMGIFGGIILKILYVITIHNNKAKLKLSQYKDIKYFIF